LVQPNKVNREIYLKLGLENEEIRKKNKEYEEYKQRLIGSDNFIARPVQTFNFQHKKICLGNLEDVQYRSRGICFC
jgi:hypothetical protein